ncbi:MAG: hypothetical protein LBC08_03615 [Campylobacteraceae bacterium]|jgi:hypothetical protein|nr:hypothetical protein [Campylobacteraceae bacterium]
MYSAAESHNIIIRDIVRIGTMITQTAANITEGLKNGDYAIFADSMEQLAIIDIDTNNINNKIVSAMPVFCKDDQIAREFVSYVRITAELIQIVYAMRYFCKNITDCINEECYIALKENLSQLFQISVDAFAMAMGLIKNSSNIKSVFRMIKTEQTKCDELLAQIEQNIIEFEFTANCIKIINISEKMGNISKGAASMAKIMLLTQDGGKLRIY